MLAKPIIPESMLAYLAQAYQPNYRLHMEPLGAENSFLPGLIEHHINFLHYSIFFI